MSETSARPIEVTLNGEPHSLDEGTTVARLIETLKMRPARVAVEINREVIPKDRFAETVIREDDLIEVINFVGGG